MNTRSHSTILAKWLPSRGSVLFTLIVAAGLLVYAHRAGAFPAAQVRTPSSSTNTLPYQGRLTDAKGAPLNGTYSMSFQLYTTASGGSALWSEEWDFADSVVVTNGLFNVVLGSLTPIPQSVITANSSLWLGISIETDSEMTPRVQVGSVPFAMQALTVPDGSITPDKLSPEARGGQYYVGVFQTPTITGTFSVTGIGFQPRLVIFMGPGSASGVDEFHLALGAATGPSARFAVGGATSEGYGNIGMQVNPAFTLRRVSAPGDNTLFEADIVSMDTDGFTLNFSLANWFTEKVGFIAFR